MKRLPPESRRPEIKRRGILLVEGETDKEIVEAILAVLKRNDGSTDKPIQVIAVGGKDAIKGFLAWLMPRMEQSNIKEPTIGVMRDADENPRGAAESIKSALENVGLTAGGGNGEFSRESPAAGGLVVPGENEEGTIETMCWKSVAETTEGRKITKNTRLKNGATKPNSRNRVKMKLRRYLDVVDGEEIGVGEAIREGTIDIKHEAFRPLVAFLQKLRNLAGSER